MFLRNARISLVVLFGGVWGCGRPPAEQRAETLTLVATIRDSSRIDSKPLFEWPAYVRSGSDGLLWTLDTGRKAVIAFGADSQVAAVAGRPGRGPGEIAISLAMDVSPDGVVWVADAGNAKIIGFRRDTAVAEFRTDHQPLGIAAPDDASVWVGGDLRQSVMIRYDRHGRRVGIAGAPVGRTPASFRFNQGVAARGTGPCAVVWAYTFYSVIDCFAPDGHMVWRAEGPERIAPATDADPNGMSPTDQFAYLDVTTSGGRVYALFFGGTPSREGLRTRTVHLFDARDGRFLQVLTLPTPAKYILRHDTTFVILDYDPVPVINVYNVSAHVVGR